MTPSSPQQLICILWAPCQKACIQPACFSWAPDAGLEVVMAEMEPVIPTNPEHHCLNSHTTNAMVAQAQQLAHEASQIRKLMSARPKDGAHARCTFIVCRGIFETGIGRQLLETRSKSSTRLVIQSLLLHRCDTICNSAGAAATQGWGRRFGDPRGPDTGGHCIYWSGRDTVLRTCGARAEVFEYL